MIPWNFSNLTRSNRESFVDLTARVRNGGEKRRSSKKAFIFKGYSFMSNFWPGVASKKNILSYV